MRSSRLVCAVAKVHLRYDAQRTRCGLALEGMLWTGGEARVVATLDALREVRERDRCRRCVQGAARDLAEAIESGEIEAPYVAPPPTPARYGARELSRTAVRAIEDSRRARDAPPRLWPSPEAAIRSYVMTRAEGASLRSTADPDRANRVQHHRDPSLGGREHAAVDRHVTVARALSRAMDAPELAELSPLSPADALDAAILVIVGHGERAPCRTLSGTETKGRALVWTRRLPEDAAIEMRERTGVSVTGAQISALVRHFTWAVRESLIASGEMGAGATRRRGWDPTAKIREVG